MMKLGILALLVLGALGALVRGVFLGYPRPPLPRSVLSAKEQAIVAACADAMFSASGPIPLSGTDAGLVAYMDAYLRRVGAGQRALIRLLFQFLEHGPWVFGPLRARFTRLPPAAQAATLDGMRTSSIYFRRLAFVSLRTMLTMGYFADPRVTGLIGWPQSTAPFEPVQAPRPEAFA
jgi:hypothetical protein